MSVRFEAPRAHLWPSQERPRHRSSGFTATLLDRSYLSVRIDLWSASLFQEDIADTERKLYAIYRERLVEILRRFAEEREVSLSHFDQWQS